MYIMKRVWSERNIFEIRFLKIAEKLTREKKRKLKENGQRTRQQRVKIIRCIIWGAHMPKIFYQTKFYIDGAGALDVCSF